METIVRSFLAEQSIVAGAAVAVQKVPEAAARCPKPSG
jgi:hypothetical protein